MVCPACGYQWNTSQNSCQQCGLRLKTTTQFSLAVKPEEARRSIARSGAFSPAESEKPFPAQGSFQGPSSPVRGPSGTLREKTSGPISPVRGPSGVLPTNSSPARLSGSLQQKSAPDPVSSELKPGTLLRQKRYRVQQLLALQNWNAGIYEATWIGRDLHHQKQVKIREVVIPDNLNVQTQAVMHTATMSLLAVRNSPQLTPLLDAFSDQGRSFFVFGLPVGETLTTQIQRLRHPFSEEAVVDFCLQMVTLLETFQRQSPPLVHGLICPEHITLSYDSSRYILGDFSILIGGRATQLLTGVDRSHLSPYVIPEFTSNASDPRNDLYAVLATAYYLATGSAPAGNSSPHARSLNPALSPAFDALLTRGLHPMLHHRYQQPVQLRQDLLALSSQAVKDSPQENAQKPPALAGRNLARSSSLLNEPASNPVSPSSLAFDEETDILLPAPETLPPLHVGYERLEAGIALLLILGSLGAVAGLSHFHI